MDPISWLVERERNRKEFIYHNYQCLILRNGALGNLCGYIALPPDHHLFGQHYDTIEDIYNYELPAHGDLTFSGEFENRYWIGFDCAHAGDYVPNSPINDEEDTYKDMNFVENNLKEIVDFIENQKN